MNARGTLVVVLVAVTSIACRPDIELEIPCASDGDLSCPTGFQCDVATGFCVAGEAAPRVVFPELDEGAHIQGRVEVAAELVSVNGIEDVVLEAKGAGNVSWTLAPTLMSGDGVQRGTWAATFDTWSLDDGPAAFQVTVSDAIGLTTTQRLELIIANGAPVVSISSPGKNETVGQHFTLNATIRSFVPVKSVVARIGGYQKTLTNEVKWKNTDNLSGELNTTFGGDLASGDATLELIVTDDAGVEGRVAVEVTVNTGA